MNFFGYIKLHISNVYTLNTRNISKTRPSLTDKAPSSEAASTAASAASANPDPHTKHQHKPNNLEKKLLVWFGKYKRIEDIPKYVSYDVMERVRNRARIRISNYMMAATAIACIIMAISGKRAAERGESVQKMNLDWHKEMNEQFKKEKEAAASAAK